MRILKSIFALLFFVSLLSPVSASTNEIFVGETTVTNIEIDGINYTYTQYSTESSNFMLVDDGNSIDIFEYNLQTNILLMNNELFGITRFTTSYSRAASCTIPLLTGLRDEQGNLAVYEGCATSNIPVGTATTAALAAKSIFTGVPVIVIQNKLLSYLAKTVLPLYLDKAMSSARQQYRSKYTMLDPYSGLYKYKRLYNSYIYVINYKLYGPSASGWFF